MKKISTICFVWLFSCGLLLAETQPSEEAEPVEEEKSAQEEEEWHSLSHGIRYQVLHEGDGKKAGLWGAVYLHFRVTGENGTVLADSYSDPNHGGRAHKFVIGSGNLVEALELVVTTMREKDRRVFLIPSELFSLYDYHSHTEGEPHDDEEHVRVAAALQPDTMVKAEVSLLWVRPYDPSNYNRFRDSTQ